MLKEKIMEKIKRPKYIILIFLVVTLATFLTAVLVVIFCQRSNNGRAISNQFKKVQVSKSGDGGAGLSESEQQIINKVKMVFSATSGQENKNPSEVFYYLKYNYHNLSVSAQEAVKPYLLRPNDPESYLHSVYSARQDGGKTSWIDTAYAAEKGRPAYNKYLVTADQKIKIWYPEITVQQDKDNKQVGLFEQQAKAIVSDYNGSLAYQKFKQLLGMEPPSDGVLGGDNKIDVYLVSSASALLKTESSFFPVAYGVTISDVVYAKENKGKTISGFVVINADLDDKQLKSTAAHELFHLFQYNYEGPGLCQYYIDKDAWWMEATAVWAEHYVYPTLNSEQVYLQSFIENPQIPLTKFDNMHAYGAYVFPFYLAQIYGDKIIKEIFDNCLAVNIVGAIQKEVLSYKGVLDDFWLWNYNKDAAKKYTDAGGFPNVSVANAATTKETYTQGKDISVAVSKMAPLSAQVLKIMVSSKNSKGKKIAEVKFDLSDYKNKSSDAAVRALVYTRDGQSHLEDWNGFKERIFYLKKGGNDDVMIMVMVLANADTKKEIEPSVIKVISKETEETEQVSYIMQGTDSREAHYYDGITSEETDVCIHTFIASASSTGPGIIPEYYSSHPFLGKWQMEYNYKSACKKGTGGVSGVVTFDLSEAYYNMVSHSQAKGGFPFKGLSPKTHGNELFGYLNLNNHWGSLYDVKEDGAKVNMNLYGDQIPNVKVDTSPLIFTIKKLK